MAGFSFYMRRMKLPRWPYLILLGLLFIAGCFALALLFGRQSRLDWELKITVKAYQKAGFTDPAWDKPAKRALTEFARMSSAVIPQDKPWEEFIREPWAQIVRTNCDAAIKAGCDDPMVNYLSIRYSTIQTNSQRDIAEAYCRAALDMEKSSYPDMDKFFAALRAIHQTTFAYGYTNANAMETVKEISRSFGKNLIGILKDKTTPPEDVYEACAEGLDEFGRNSDDYRQVYSTIEPLLFTNWPNESTSWLLKGRAYNEMAWTARGGGYVSTVTEEGEKIFETDLAIAENALTNAWKLNPKDARIADKMISVELGQGQGRDQMELWFDRAMKIDPDDLDACNAKLIYIEPKWHGSVQDMLDFGRECLQNTNWGGRVPIILVNVHDEIYNLYIDESEQTNYWKRPEVWHDVKASYDRFFELNPNATYHYQDYAYHAYQAEQWGLFVELAPKVVPESYGFFSEKYGYFGGKDKFDQMVRYAKRMIRYDRRHGIVPPQ
jgi:tetratricopeptide (TPR) repeat protein